MFTFTTNLELYAKWQPNTYTIHYDAHGGENEIEDIVLTYDVLTEIADGTAFEKLGYKPVGSSMKIHSIPVSACTFAITSETPTVSVS